MRKVVGLDIETVDPLLKTSGYSWKQGQGYILNTALYYEADDKVKVIAGLHNDNCPYDEEDRARQNMEIKGLLLDPEVSLVGANIMYDIGWLLYEYKLTVYDLKCRLIDVLSAEACINEFEDINLDNLSWKYLRYGKKKERIEEWVRANISAKGDFRQHLKDAPWDLLCEYVMGDAQNPVKIWRKQLTILKEENLTERVKLDFDCILPILQITINGFPINMEQKRQNLKTLTEYRNLLRKEFMDEYHTDLNVNSSRQIASFCDAHSIAYRMKITLTGASGKKFADYKETDSAFDRAKKLVSSFQYVKRVPVAYVPVSIAERTCDLLTEEGFDFNCSPNIDKKYFASERDNHPAIGIIADWKNANGIISKILGEQYDRFVSLDSDGVYRVHAQYHISKSEGSGTISSRLSSSHPNCIAEGTRVLTDKGYVPVEELCTGDSVYNGNGNLTTVRNVWCKGERNCLSLVSADGSCLVCTPEHKLWNGSDWVKAEDLYDTDIITKRADCLSVQENAHNSSDCRSFNACTRNCGECVEKGTCRRGERGTANKAQEQVGGGLHRPCSSEKVCGGVHISEPTLIQRTMSKVQSFSEQGKELSEGLSDQGAESGTAQSKGSTGTLQTERCDRENAVHLQRGLCRWKGLSNDTDEQSGLCKEKFRAQGENGTGNRNRCGTSSERVGRSSYRPQPLEQRLGELGSMYTISTQKIARATCGVRKVYDIEVGSSDHSFIAENFRVKNCQQIPSKGGFVLKNGGNEINVSFPALTRSLFTCEKGGVYFKIDYSQVEYRLIVNYAVGDGAEEARALFNKDPHTDFHQYTVDLTGLSRKLAKNMSFGVSFGMGLKSMAENFGWTMEKAQEISDQYHAHIPFVAPTLSLVGDIAKERGYIRTVLGNKARLRNPKQSYTMLNRLTQGSGADILKASIVRAFKEGVWKDLKIHTTVHDELGGTCYPTEEQVKRVIQLEDIMENTVKLKIPLLAEAEFGTDWQNVKEPKEWLELKKSNDDEWVSAPSELKTVVELYAKLKGMEV